MPVPELDDEEEFLEDNDDEIFFGSGAVHEEIVDDSLTETETSISFNVEPEPQPSSSTAKGEQLTLLSSVRSCLASSSLAGFYGLLGGCVTCRKSETNTFSIYTLVSRLETET